jgi:hypothetical protein
LEPNLPPEQPASVGVIASRRQSSYDNAAASTVPANTNQRIPVRKMRPMSAFAEGSWDQIMRSGEPHIPRETLPAPRNNPQPVCTITLSPVLSLIQFNDTIALRTNYLGSTPRHSQKCTHAVSIPIGNIVHIEQYFCSQSPRIIHPSPRPVAPVMGSSRFAPTGFLGPPVPGPPVRYEVPPHLRRVENGAVEDEDWDW